MLEPGVVSPSRHAAWASRCINTGALPPPQTHTTHKPLQLQVVVFPKPKPKNENRLADRLIDRSQPWCSPRPCPRVTCPCTPRSRRATSGRLSQGMHPFPLSPLQLFILAIGPAGYSVSHQFVLAGVCAGTNDRFICSWL